MRVKTGMSIIGVCTCIISFGQHQSYEQSLEQRLNGKDSSVVFIAIVRSNQLVKYFPEKTFAKYYDKETHLFNSNVQESRDAFRRDILSCFKNTSDKGKILKIIGTWQKDDSVLDALTTRGNIQVEKVLYDNPSTRSLFKKFLTVPKQSWESLSSWQSYELYVDFMNFAAKLSEAQRLNLFQHLKSIAKNW